MSDSDIPVVVVGAGPVGMQVALQLAHLGVRCLIVNKQPESVWHPRGNTHNSRTMEHYRRLGLSKAIRTLGLPPSHPTDVGYFTSLAGPEIARIPMPSEAEKAQAARDAAPSDQIVEPLFRCNQMYVERFLTEQLHASANIMCRFGWDCVDWEDEGDRVRVEIVDVVTGQKSTLQCRYLVGCDGARSTVRRKYGIQYDGKAYREQSYAGGLTASTFIRAPDLYKSAIRKRCWQYSIASPLVRSNFYTLDGEEHFSFLTRLKPRDNESEKDAILRQLDLSIGTRVRAEYISHFLWTAGQALVADSYGQGRVVMAGDAIHLFTPQGGFGMNTGVDDGVNLAWKLAALVNGWGGPGLLRSYETERRPIAIRNTSAAQAIAHRVGDIPISNEMLDESEAGAQARNVAAQTLLRMKDEFSSIGVQLGARYDGSPIVVGDGRAPADSFDEYLPSASPGGRAPHYWLRHRVSLFDLFGPGFTLLCFRRREHQAGALRASAAKRRMPLTVLPIDADEARDLYESDFALIRPDQHVAWRGNDIPDDGDQLLATVTGWT